MATVYAILLDENGEPDAALSAPVPASMAKAYRLLLPTRYRNFPPGSIVTTVPDHDDPPVAYGLPGTGVSVPPKLSTVKAATDGVLPPDAAYTNLPDGCAAMANTCPLVANGEPDTLVSVPAVASIAYPLTRVLDPPDV
jgi:hypothetical protein